MAEKPIKTPLPADLPENWNAGQIVAPDGTTVGLTEQHGYNYLMAAVNRAQRGVNAVNDAFETVSGKRTGRFVVGTYTAGWTEADCDFLCDGTDDQDEINLAIETIPRYGGEVVLLDGEYRITGQIHVSDGIILRGNGPETSLIRDVVSIQNTENTKGAIINVGTHSALRDLFVGSSVDAPDAAQICADSGSTISNVSINLKNVSYFWGPHNVGIGIYARSSGSGGRIENCIFGNVTTAIHLRYMAETIISGCTTIWGTFDNIDKFVPYFIVSEKTFFEATVIGNQAIKSAVQMDVDGFGVIISDNFFSQLTITNSTAESQTTASRNGGNLIANNVFGFVSDDPVILLEKNATGWFVTGNQIRDTAAANKYGAIVDKGIKNDVRFNSNDQGGSTPATVQQATPTISVNDGTVTARATQAAGYVAAGTRSATYQISSVDDANLMPDNIKEGVSIFGVTGKLQSGGGAGGVTSSNGSVADIQAVTQEEYDALAIKNPTTLYLIKE